MENVSRDQLVNNGRYLYLAFENWELRGKGRGKEKYKSSCILHGLEEADSQTERLDSCK